MSSSDADDPSYWPPQSAQPRLVLPSDEHNDTFSAISSEETSLTVDENVEEEEPQIIGAQRPVNLQDDEVSPSRLAQSDLESTSLLPMRPNKYNGPPSTWRSWTAADRAISNSLDQLRAEDLSIHLYNAHALKKRCRGTNAKDEKTEDNKWQPGKLWTAWPMNVDDVPRGQTGSLQADTYVEDLDLVQHTHKPAKPSQDLEDSLTATILKGAKERFLHREWADESSDSENPVDNEEESCSTTREGHRYPNNPPHAVTIKPIISADDDHSATILRPQVRHLLTRLDELLLGLHHSRQACLPTTDDTQSETQTDVDDAFPQATKRKASNSRASSKRGRSRKRSHELSDPSSSRDSSPLKPKHKRRRSLSPVFRTRRLHDRQARLGLRDWSDILGVASIQGWPASVLARTAERCAGLFDEGIKFRTLQEGKQVSLERTYLPALAPTQLHPRTTRYHEKEVNASADPSDSPSLTNVPNTGRDGKLYCPLPTCPRSKRGFSRDWNFQGHFKRMHSSHQKISTDPDSERPDGDEEAMYGAVHVDGFLQPIKAQKGWRGKSKSARGGKGKEKSSSDEEA